MISHLDTVIVAFAEAAGGPGWSNTPVWVVVQEPMGKLRVECLQPDEQSHEMATLYGVSSAIHAALTNEVRKLYGRTAYARAKD